MLGIYCRLSIDDDASNSIENQISEGKVFADKNNFKENEIKIYQEKKGLKGDTPIKKRPQLQRLIDDINNNIITMVFVRTQSRISRNLFILREFLNSVEAKDIKVVLDGVKILDLSNSQTKLFVSIMGAFDEFSPNKQSEMTIKAISNRVKEGKISGGVLPYGYVKNNQDKPIIDEYESNVVKRIFKEFIGGKSIRSIAADLNDDNILTKTQIKLKAKNTTYKATKKRFINDELVLIEREKNGWLRQTVHGILKNTWYVGIRKFKKQEIKDVPPIISKEDFNKAKKVLKNNITKRGKVAEHRYILKGVLVCGNCNENYNGRRLYDSTKKRKYKSNYYTCASKRKSKDLCNSSSFSILHLESFIIKLLFKNNDLTKKLEIESASNDIVIKLKKELTSLKELHNQKSIEADIINKRLNTQITTKRRLILENDLYNLDNYIDGIETKITNVEDKIESKTNSKALKEFKAINKTFNKEWSFEEYQKALNKIIDKIEIYTFKDIKNTKCYQFKINYVGFEYEDIFIVKKPYKKWLHRSKTYVTPTLEDIIEDFEDYVNINNFNIENDIPLKKLPPKMELTKQKLLNYKDYVNDIDELKKVHRLHLMQDFYNGDTDGVIYLDESELVDFD